MSPQRRQVDSGLTTAPNTTQQSHPKRNARDRTYLPIRSTSAARWHLRRFCRKTTLDFFLWLKEESIFGGDTEVTAVLSVIGRGCLSDLLGCFRCPAGGSELLARVSIDKSEHFFKACSSSSLFLPDCIGIRDSPSFPSVTLHSVVHILPTWREIDNETCCSHGPGPKQHVHPSILRM